MHEDIGVCVRVRARVRVGMSVFFLQDLFENGCLYFIV